MKHFSVYKTHKDMCGSAFQLHTISKRICPSERGDHQGTMNDNGKLQMKEAAKMMCFQREFSERSSG